MYVVEQSLSSGLHRSFGRANLPLNVFSREDPTFRLDIDPPRAWAPQVYRVWPGEDTIVQVKDTDSKRRQLILAVKEPVRAVPTRVPTFRVRNAIHEHGSNWLYEIKQEGGIQDKDILAVNRDDLLVEFNQWTPEEGSTMLLGHDERQLFVAGVPAQVSTVAAAHEALKPRSDRAGEYNRRQGEWFFRDPTEAEQVILGEKLKMNLIERKVGIGQAADSNFGRWRPGKPGPNDHVADEVVVHPGKIGDTRMVFVRGQVRHPEHKTLKLLTWQRVLINGEPRTSMRNLGITWVD